LTDAQEAVATQVAEWLANAATKREKEQ